MASPLVVVGSANADMYIEVERIPAPGETVTGEAGAVLPGGKGANQAACAAKLGYPTYFVGQVSPILVCLLTSTLISYSHVSPTQCTPKISFLSVFFEMKSTFWYFSLNSSHDYPIPVGRDENGKLLSGALSHSGVRLDHLGEVAGPTGLALVMLQPSG